MATSYADVLGYPLGWFVIAESSEVRPGEVKTFRIAGEDIVVFRTKSGQVHACEPYCPHLGAHLGHSGEVEGEFLRCNFHGFCFSGGGECAKTGYGTRPPPNARIKTFEVREMHEVILIYYHPEGQKPAWEIPVLDVAGWSPMRFYRYTFRGHPQETTENAADIGHFVQVHKYLSVEQVRPVHCDGQLLTARYAMRRPVVPGLVLGTEFEVYAYGLGYSRVDVDVRSHGFQTRQFFFPVLRDGDTLQLRLGISARMTDGLRRLGWLGALLPERLMADTAARLILEVFKAEVRKDIPIWSSKTYKTRPALATGDGPIGMFRKWARQFYVTPMPAGPA